MDLAAGRTVDRYVVEARLGQGAMASVYRVRHNELGTEFALKVLTLPLASVRERLLQEGRAQSALRHPNVVAVTDIVEVDGAPGLVMEYVDGPTLEQRIAARPLDDAELDAIARGLCRGMAHAHRVGMVHRDLKPANVLLRVDAAGIEPKITDFGLVKVLTSEQGVTQTRSGAPLGTPCYMAPEQIRDPRSVDARADVWALGTILYEAVARRRAFAAADVVEVFGAVTSARYTSIRSVRADLPDRMASAIGGALCADRERRIPDCDTLLAVWSGERRWIPPRGPEPQDGEMLDDTWRVVARLGGDARGPLYEVESAMSGKRFAARWLGTAEPSADIVARARDVAAVQHLRLAALVELRTGPRGAFLLIARPSGVPLAEWRAAHPGPVEASRIRGWMRSCGEALVALHDAGLAHGAVEPANVFVTDDQASLMEPLVGRLDDTFAPVAATPYTAPEVVAGRPPTARSDVFSLGATALTLEPRGALRAAFERATAKDAASRYADGDELIAAIATRSWSVPVAAAFALVPLLAFGAAAVAWWPTVDPAPPLVPPPPPPAPAPALVEVCDGVDNDGDAQIDEGLPTTRLHRDSDGDGHGDPADFVDACGSRAGYVEDATDCADADAAVWAGSDGYDESCRKRSPPLPVVGGGGAVIAPPPVVTGRGTLKVNSRPWSDVFIDGVEVGETDWMGEVAAGTHSVRLRRGDGQGEKILDLSVAPGATEALCWDFKAETTCPVH